MIKALNIGLTIGIASFLGAVVWSAFHPHGSVARFIIALLKSSPFSI